jgi:hypothetical protein
MAKALQKPGKEGPLFFYRITYTGREHDPGMTPMTWSTWAYNLEHAEDKFYDTDDGEGWTILSIARVLDSTSQHRAIQHKPRHAMEFRGVVPVLSESRNPRPQSHGFIVIDTRTGEVLSDLFKRRDGAREALDEILKKHGRRTPSPGDVEYRNGLWYRSLGVHQVMLYPGDTYSSDTYRP